MAAKRATKVVSIAARITADQAAVLDEVQAAAPELPSRSAAVGRVLDWVTAADIDDADAAAGKEASVLPPAAVATLLDALGARTRAYSSMAKEIRAIGNNLNQLVRLGHQSAIYGTDAEVAVDAVHAIARQLEDVIANELTRLATQDTHVETTVRACLPQ